MSTELVPLSWCLCHLSAPRQLGSSWSAHCSISLCREIDWEEVQGEMGHQGNQLGESGRGTGSGQQPRHGSKHKEQPHGSSRQSSASDVPPLPVPTAMQDREGLYPFHHVKSTGQTAASSFSHWLLLATAVVGFIHRPVVSAAHCFYSTATIFARMCGSCLLCLVPASGSLQVPRTGGHLREPGGVSGSEAGGEEGTPFPAHQKASSKNHRENKHWDSFKKPSVQPWHLANPMKILLMITSDNQFPLRKDFHSCHLLSHSLS